MKKSELVHATTWINHEESTLSERSRTQKAMLYDSCLYETYRAWISTGTQRSVSELQGIRGKESMIA